VLSGRENNSSFANLIFISVNVMSTDYCKAMK
jgi:hypothetical protein